MTTTLFPFDRGLTSPLGSRCPFASLSAESKDWALGQVERSRRHSEARRAALRVPGRELLTSGCVGHLKCDSIGATVLVVDWHAEGCETERDQ